jgi:N-dimethylarginine dimethylaminohydrolase
LPWSIDSETGLLTDVPICRPDHYQWIETNATYREVMATSYNLLALGGDRVISPPHRARINAALRAQGLKVLDPELDLFATGGGSVHCMTMSLAREPA